DGGTVRWYVEHDVVGRPVGGAADRPRTHVVETQNRPVLAVNTHPHLRVMRLRGPHASRKSPAASAVTSCIDLLHQSPEAVRSGARFRSDPEVVCVELVVSGRAAGNDPSC